MREPTRHPQIATVTIALIVAYALCASFVQRYGAGVAYAALSGLASLAVAYLVWRVTSLRARIRRSWPHLSHALGLWQQKPIARLDATFEYHLPSIARISRHPHGLEVWVALLPGQSPQQLADHVEAIAHTWRVFRVEATSPARGVVVLRVWKSDPLEEPFPAVPVGGSSNHGRDRRESSKEGHLQLPAASVPEARPALEATGGDMGERAASMADAGAEVASWRPEFAAVEIGLQENGEPWRLRLHGTHVLVAGVTGAGKGSILWGAIRGLLPLVRVGLVELWACDPKRMELSFGRGLFHRYASDPAGMVDLLELAAVRMSDRADEFAGRVRAHMPTPGSPLTLVIVDELAFLTAYQSDRDLRKRAEAAIATLTSQGRSVGFCVLGALQDPRKEVMNIRNLFPDRIALRLDEPAQVDMVLGLGARDRGALADLISPEPRIGAGVGYIKNETAPEPIRVRAAYVSDADIAAMVADFGRDARLGGAA